MSIMPQHTHSNNIQHKLLHITCDSIKYKCLEHMKSYVIVEMIVRPGLAIIIIIILGNLIEQKRCFSYENIIILT